MIRSKQPEADLKRSYRRLLGISAGVSVLLHTALFAFFPTFELKPYAKPQAPVIIQLEQIPETRQDRRPPAPSRPVVPVVSDNPDVPDDATIETTELDLNVADLPPPPPLPQVEAAEEKMIELAAEEEEVVELWKVEKPPEVKKKVAPDYPEIARKAGIEDKVFALVLVGRDGKVEKVGQITGPEVFHESVRSAAMQWEFSPAIQNDRPVRVWVSLPFTFQLK